MSTPYNQFEFDEQEYAAFAAATRTVRAVEILRFDADGQRVVGFLCGKLHTWTTYYSQAQNKYFDQPHDPAQPKATPADAQARGRCAFWLFAPAGDHNPGKPDVLYAYEGGKSVADQIRAMNSEYKSEGGAGSLAFALVAKANPRLSKGFDIELLAKERLQMNAEFYQRLWSHCQAHLKPPPVRDAEGRFRLPSVVEWLSAVRNSGHDKRPKAEAPASASAPNPRLAPSAGSPVPAQATAGRISADQLEELADWIEERRISEAEVKAELERFGWRRRSHITADKLAEFKTALELPF